jgi:hypothetical protein
VPTSSEIAGTQLARDTCVPSHGTCRISVIMTGDGPYDKKLRRVQREGRRTRRMSDFVSYESGVWPAANGRWSLLLLSSPDTAHSIHLPERLMLAAEYVMQVPFGPSLFFMASRQVPR